ncbi:MAG: LptA/OstA family protein [Paracoccaceae bacterium]|nr:LptA/OstA family protein [Paracoccaceae bacterium]
MTKPLRQLLLAACLFLAPPGAWAQGANVALGTAAFDSGQPVEVTADSLSVDQETGRAVFDGNVLVVQGEVRLSAGQIVVEYATDADGATTGISRLMATGGVTFVTATDAAEASEAVYSVADSTVSLSGDVLLTQGQTALSGDRLVIDLNSGSGRIEGRVRTIFGGSDN